MKTDASLHTKIVSDLHAVKVDGKELYCKFISPKDITHRMAVGVRHAGNDGSASFRIPGLVTTNKGTLLGVYDVRYNSSVDLQEYVDVGLSRSIDGGKSWEKMRLPLSFGEYGGLPKAQNGVGDPSILVDTQTNTVWVVAAWTHGMGNQRAWWSSHSGMDINHTAQLVLAKSTDDGKTWSKPINITEQVKDPSWYFLLQGPGRGITMSDGTLVFPTQFIDSTRVPNAGIMYSKDRGKTWKMHNMARTNTTEAQVAEIEGLVHFKAQWEAIQPDLKKARQLDVQIQSQQSSYIQSQQILQAANRQVAEQEQKMRVAAEQLQVSYSSLNRLLSHVGIEEALQLEQVEEILRQEESKLVAATSTNEERLLRLNSFGYPLLAEEQVKLQKELTRQQNIRQLTETQTKAKTEIERLEKEVANCLKQLTEQETALKVTQRLYENARMAVGKDVKALRRQLQEGEACPVCGSTAHPYHQEQEVVDTLFRSIEQEYNVASTNYQQMNNRSIALQRDWTHQKTVDGQIAEQLAALYKAGIEAGNEEQIQHRLAELAKCILEYRNLYAEWQLGDEEIKKMRAHCEALRENVSLCRLAMQKVSSAKEQLVILQNAASAELKRFEVIEKALNVLRQERSQLLKGKSADEAEAAVAKREKELNLALEKARKEVEAVHNRLSGLQGEMKQIALAIGELQEQYKKIESPELLPEIIKKQQEENLNIERALSTMEARLLQQAKNKLTVEQIAKELAEKQTVAERWAKLNKLIGSADGAKFKVIAQSYTLNLLLLHANQHLSYLSKRYKLQQVPDTLALQVIDCDMCDEIRTVYSLSGGESFLISLALALGLSSLSSNNLKVESLFIDEGFGSLDAESLRTAMEALEQLQMQGRKIGVISHVQEMSERISVQVQVHKKVNGKSVLTVVG